MQSRSSPFHALLYLVAKQKGMVIIMIEHLAQKVSKYYSDRLIIDPSKQKIYSYGFELLISTAFNFIGVFLISCIFKNFLGAFLFMVAFIPLRLTAGGYHAKHHWSCILGFNLIFLLFMILLSCLDSKVLSLYSFTTAIISSVLICCLAPTEAANKPLNHKQYLQQKNRSITLSLINIALAIISNLTIYQFARLYTYYSSGALCTGLLLVAAKAGKGDILPRHIS